MNNPKLVCGFCAGEYTTRLQEETAMMERMRAAQAERDAEMAHHYRLVRRKWFDLLTPNTAPSLRVLLPWIQEYGVQEICEAIETASPHYTQGKFDFDERAINRLIPYVAAILRNRKRDYDKHAAERETEIETQMRALDMPGPKAVQ